MVPKSVIFPLILLDFYVCHHLFKIFFKVMETIPCSVKAMSFCNGKMVVNAMAIVKVKFAFESSPRRENSW